MVSTAVWAIAGFLGDGRDPAHRHRPGLGRPRAHRARHAAARHGGGADRRHGVVPPRRGRRDADRHPRPGALLQLHDRDRARAVRAVPRGARARGAGQPQRRPARQARASSSRRGSPRFRNGCAEHLVGETACPSSSPRSRCSSRWSCRCSPTSRSVTRPGPRSSPSRCARSRSSCSPAGAVSSRSARWRSPVSARSPRGALIRGLSVQHRVARHPDPRRRAPEHLVPVGAAARRGRSPASSR